MPKKSKPSRRKFKLLLTAIFLVGGFTGLNVAIHVMAFADDFYHGEDQRLRYVTCFTRLWKNESETTRYTRHPDINTRHELNINSYGLLGPEIEREKTSGTLRIAVIGDSFVENAGLEEQYRLTSKLETLFEEHYKQPCEVLNGGTNGYGTDQQYYLWKECVKDLKPDIVLHVFYQNDIQNIHNNGIFKLENGLPVDRRLQFGPAAGGFMNSLPIAQYVARSKADTNTESIDLYAKALDPKASAALELYGGILGTMKKDVESAGAKFYSVIASNIFLYEKKERWLGAARFSNRVLDIHRKLGIETLDMHELWRTHPKVPFKPFFFQYDRHWTEMGCHRAALDILNFLDRIEFKKNNGDIFTLQSHVFETNPRYADHPLSNRNIGYGRYRNSLFAFRTLPNPWNQILVTRNIRVMSVCRVDEPEKGWAIEFSLPNAIPEATTRIMDDYLHPFVDSVRPAEKFKGNRFHDLFGYTPLAFESAAREYAIGDGGDRVHVCFRKDRTVNGAMAGIMYIPDRGIESTTHAISNYIDNQTGDALLIALKSSERHLGTTMTIDQSVLILECYLETPEDLDRTKAVVFLKDCLAAMEQRVKRLDFSGTKLLDLRGVHVSLNLVCNKPFKLFRKSNIKFIQLNTSGMAMMTTYKEWYLDGYNRTGAKPVPVDQLN